jgi:hypothetical protein
MPLFMPNVTNPLPPVPALALPSKCVPCGPCLLMLSQRTKKINANETSTSVAVALKCRYHPRKCQTHWFPTQPPGVYMCRMPTLKMDPDHPKQRPFFAGALRCLAIRVARLPWLGPVTSHIPLTATKVDIDDPRPDP